MLYNLLMTGWEIESEHVSICVLLVWWISVERARCYGKKHMTYQLSFHTHTPPPSKICPGSRRYDLCSPPHPELLNKSPLSLIPRSLYEHVWLCPCVWCDGVGDHRFHSSHITDHRVHTVQTCCLVLCSCIHEPSASSQRVFLLFIADIDECATGRHTCGPEQTCYNTRGSYTCQCPLGYQRSGDHCVGESHASSSLPPLALSQD